MTQEDLQRDVEMLTRLHFRQRGHIAAIGNGAFTEVAADTLAALDRAIETARILASMSDEQREHAFNTAVGLVAANKEAAEVSVRRGSGSGDMYRDRADAHRKVARLMGGGA